jgi:amino acid adenylation domain-containing protein
MSGLLQVVADRAAAKPDGIACRFLERGEAEAGHLTHAVLHARVRALAGHLQALGRRGDRAILAYPTGLEFPVAFLACLAAGIVAVPVEVPRRRDASATLLAVARECGASLYLTEGRVRDRLPVLDMAWVFTDEAEAPEPPVLIGAGGFAGDAGDSPDDTAYLQYTSGSTRAPRGVVITHGAMMRQLEFYSRRAGADWQDRAFVGWLPHTHDFGLVGFVLSGLYMGATHVAMSPSSFLAKPARWIEAISRYRGAYCGGPCFGYELTASAAEGRLTGMIDLSCWAVASLGGDYISPATLARFEEVFTRYGFDAAAWFPAYGLAESVLCVTGRNGVLAKDFDAAALRRRVAQTVAGPGLRLISCGTAMPGQVVRIVDPETRLSLPEGRVGEIWVAGGSLGQGYWGDGMATDAQFGALLSPPDPQVHAEGVRHLRTGDLGFQHDGELFVTGRMKDMIVFRGANHTPEEIEATVQAVDPALGRGRGAVVQGDMADEARVLLIQEVRRDGATETGGLFARVNAAVTAAHGLDLDEIILIRQGTLPRTGNGKIARHACLAAYHEGKLHRVASWHRRQDGGATTLAEIEAQMLARLRGLLPGVPASADDNLLQLGMDSLAAQGLLAWVNERFGVDLPARTVFEAPSVGRLAALVSGLASGVRGSRAAAEKGMADGETAGAILRELRSLNAGMAEQTRLLAGLIEVLSRREAGAGRAVASRPSDDIVLPLTETQREIRMLAEIRDGAHSVFNILMVLEFTQPPDPAAVRRALRRLVVRHDALRLVMEGEAQRVLPYIEPVIEKVTLAGAGALQDWLRGERLARFDLGRGPLWRVALVATPQAQLFVLTAHHLILDGSSLPDLVEAFTRAYGGEDEALEAAPSFGDYVYRWDGRRSGAQAHRAYWQALLDPQAPDWAPPRTGMAAKPAAYDAAVHEVAIKSVLRNGLIRRAGASGATLFHALLAAYFILLHRMSGQDRIMIGVDAASRQGDDASVVGCCNALVPVVMDFAQTGSSAAFIEQVRTRVIEAMERKDYSLSMWAADNRRPVDADRLFKIAATINMQRFPTQVGPLVPRFDLEMGTLTQSPFGLALEIRDSDNGLRADFVYNREFLDAPAVARMSDYYRALLEGLAWGGDGDVLALDMLSAPERDEIAAWGRSAQPAMPFESFLQRFAAQCRATPTATAVTCGQRTLDYRQLWALSDRLAADIQVREVPPGSVVSLLHSRGSLYLAAMLGILKAGCVYLPLDPKSPRQRLRAQVDQARAALILHDQDNALAARAIGGDGGPALAEVDGRVSAEPAALLRGAEVLAELPAYVLFTSGSTGAPKAAVVTHGGMINHLRAKIALLDMGPQDVLAQTASQGFDISVWQYLAPLLVGARVAVFDDPVAHDPEALFHEAGRRGITILQTVPSLLGRAVDLMLPPERRPELAALRWLISTGEALPAETCRRWIAIFPNVPMVNAYGPTECSDDVTHQKIIWPPKPEVLRVPIGKPIPGAELRVMNRAGGQVPIGSPGELHIGGPCVGLGYLNDPRRTAAAFVPDEAAADPRARLYRTGDLVRFLEDGGLDYLGRVDQQVKVNGVRIEPREIEAAINNDPMVMQSLVVTRPAADGATVLVAYVVPRPGKTVLEGGVKAVARIYLPPSLMPSRIVVLEHMPLNANGKIDLAALPDPSLRPQQADETPPHTQLQEDLVAVWSEILGLRGFGIHADLFDLGGRSMDASRIAVQVSNRFDVALPVTEIFRAPTVAGIAGYVEWKLAEKSGDFKEPAMEVA